MKNILFVVSKSTGYLALKSFLNHGKRHKVVILTLDDKGDPRSKLEEITTLCSEMDVSIHYAQSGKCLENILDEESFDVAFVCGWYWIIPERCLEKVSQGVYAVHNSLLPKYRGHAPLIWGMVNGDKHIGSSLFRMDEGMDSGLVYHQWIVDRERLTTTEVLRKLDEKIGISFGGIFSQVVNGRIKGEEQDHIQASYAAKRRPEDGVINWGNDAKDIANQVRALSPPYPWAFTVCEGRKVFLRKVIEFDFPVFGEPGQVVFKKDKSVIICCGNNTGIEIVDAVNDEGEDSVPKLFRKISSPKKFFENGKT